MGAGCYYSKFASWLMFLEEKYKKNREKIERIARVEKNVCLPGSMSEREGL
jgi:hypothetical protein